MYSRKTWGGPVDPHILVKFLPVEGTADSDPIVSLVIFEWEDYDLVGVVTPDNPSMVRSYWILSILRHNLTLT
jgi:hypothetical protein